MLPQLGALQFWIVVLYSKFHSLISIHLMVLLRRPGGEGAWCSLLVCPGNGRSQLVL